MTDSLASPPKKPQDWFSRNWKWFIPLVCFVGLALCMGFIFLILSVMKSSDAYQGALFRVQNSPAAKEILGEPIKAGIFFTGNIKISGSSGQADLAIPVCGPKGEATVYVLAKKTLGEWHFQRLIIQEHAAKRRIDISDPPLQLSK